MISFGEACHHDEDEDEEVNYCGRVVEDERGAHLTWTHHRDAIFKIEDGRTRHQISTHNELWEPSNGFIVNDTCIIKVEILVSKPKHENQLDQPNNKIHDKPLKHIENPLHEEMFTTFGKLVDFKGLGKIEQDFIPLLEEVCSQHPSRINSQKKRTRRFIEWAFTVWDEFYIFLRIKG
ncbi:hypothetical protein Fmac_020294 [Flemingia macrophylla]|uniref:Uncharacterized protein n=1 Tax=Flemingia macrophylla TaxID=520843 RepID=A0ABD1LTP2_9FABA